MQPTLITTSGVAAGVALATPILGWVTAWGGEGEGKKCFLSFLLPARPLLLSQTDFPRKRKGNIDKSFGIINRGGGRERSFFFFSSHD